MEQQVDPREWLVWQGRAFPAVEPEQVTFVEARAVEAACGVVAQEWPAGMFQVQVGVFASVARVEPLLLSWDELSSSPVGTFIWTEAPDEATAVAQVAEYLADAQTPLTDDEPASAALPGGSGDSVLGEAR